MWYHSLCSYEDALCSFSIHKFYFLNFPELCRLPLFPEMQLSTQPWWSLLQFDVHPDVPLVTSHGSVCLPKAMNPPSLAPFPSPEGLCPVTLPPMSFMKVTPPPPSNVILSSFCGFLLVSQCCSTLANDKPPYKPLKAHPANLRGAYKGSSQSADALSGSVRRHTLSDQPLGPIGGLFSSATAAVIDWALPYFRSARYTELSHPSCDQFTWSSSGFCAVLSGKGFPCCKGLHAVPRKRLAFLYWICAWESPLGHKIRHGECWQLLWPEAIADGIISWISVLSLITLWNSGAIAEDLVSDRSVNLWADNFAVPWEHGPKTCTK